MDKQKKDWGLIIATGLLIVGILMVFFPYYILNGLSFWHFKIGIDKYNELGDFIVGVSAPFLSMAAFILLYKTYKSQKDELKSQKEELRENKLLLNKQNENISLQQFETTFFNLLNLHHQITSALQFKYSTAASAGKNQTLVRTGRSCFEQYYSIFISIYLQLANHQKVTKEQKRHFDANLEMELIESSYDQAFDKFQSEIGHYFRNLYHIIKFIDNSDVVNKGRYTSLVRAQLSTFELMLLFYNCLWHYEGHFKKLIEDYHLLKNYTPDKLALPEHEKLYNLSAFKK